MSTTTVSADPADEAAPRRRGIFERLWDAKPWMAAGFLLTSFAYGTALFVVLVTLLSLGVGLAIIWIGIPILAITMLIWIGAAMLERQRIRLFFGIRIESPYRPRPKGSLLKRARVLIGDVAVWRDLFYDFLLFPIGIAEFTIATVAISLPIMLLAAPSYFWIGNGLDIFGDSSTGSGWQVDTFPEAILVSGVGALLLIPAIWAIVGMARVHVWFARWMLGPSRAEVLEERVEVLTKTRSDVMDAMMGERRRIERDLHDGAQQRLVSLAMNLGMAKTKMATDPEAAQALISASHDEAKQVLGELRELVRGIHPAVLTDRGLDAAISSIAGHCPVPVSVDVQLAERPPEAVESTAYFIVAEALTNVAKHSDASRATVHVAKRANMLRIEIWDDGKGGASMYEGTGLHGLGDRVAALDGRFGVVSPPDGGTRVIAEIPCES